MILDWALSFLVGCGIRLHFHWMFLLPLCSIALLSKRKGQSLAFLMAGVMVSHFYTPTLKEGPHTGKGIFTLSSITPIQSPFQRSYALKGILDCFETKGQFHYKLPCVLFQRQVPKEGHQFYIEGTLENNILKPSKRPIAATKRGFSLARWRFNAKERVRKHFHKLRDKKVGHFFASMTTGDVDDRLLSMEFRKWGLSHILAISGFHFALLAFVLRAFLRLLFPRNPSFILLIGLLTLAFLYLGPSPSIVRAYLMISLYLLGLWLGRIPDPLNLLGIALLLELSMNPLQAVQVGFQLSFLATFSILTLYQPIEQKLQTLFPKRPMDYLKQFSLLDKHGYLLSAALRKSLALNLAVHLATLPILLVHFHSFPLMSLLFNLVIPPLLGLSMIGLPLGPLNVMYTRFLLDILSHAPENLNFQIVAPNFPFELALGLCTIIGTLGLTLWRKIGQNGGLLRWRS